ncbi:MAG: mechanosensitive ion channel domain-containing protein, partial [Gemmatimonadota bacterium]
MRESAIQRGTVMGVIGWLGLAGLGLGADRLLPGLLDLESGLSILELVSLLAGLLATAEILSLISQAWLTHKGKPAVEGEMVGRIYRLLAILAVMLGTAYGFGALGTFGTFFSLFGGMLLGWSLQAPVSGFAAWILVSVKRPFRPGDRIQFPNLGLTGDVKDMGPMYTALDQVGGTIGSEEAVGRHILVPNAMLFSQVVINYTVLQESPYMLDETIVRITFDSDWEAAESILLNAARELTREIIDVTGVEPYIRADPYDYGVFMRLRYQTRVKDRAEIAYRINRHIFDHVQKSESVDLAIPYVYSYRKGSESKEVEIGGTGRTRESATVLELDRIVSSVELDDTSEIEQAARGMSPQWLHYPIVVTPPSAQGKYRIIAGHLQYEVCKLLGWKTISAVIVDKERTLADG